MVIEHADFDGTERLAAVLGADIVSNFSTFEGELPKLGTCSLIEEIMIGEDKVIKFSGCTANQACSIVLRGSGSHILDEAERSLHDALCVLIAAVKSHKVVYGGGNSEIRMSLAVEELGRGIKGKQALAVQSYANALKQLPTIITDNAGFDSAEIVQNLRSEIHNGNLSAGLNMWKGEVGDMQAMGITECFRVKEQALLSASEAAELILRVDEIIRCAPRKREGQ
jgi:T-complex protein 1 subunit beta